MLEKINENLIVDRESGIEIRIRIPKWFIEFVNGANVARVAIEPVISPDRLAVYSESLDEWTCPEGLAISPSERAFILEKIGAVLDFLDCAHEIV